MRLLLIIALLSTTFQLVGCKKSPANGENESTEDSISDQNFPLQDDQGNPVSTNNVDLQHASLEQGSLTIFGLTLPKGMAPLPGPNKVYRFESGHPLDMMKENIERQVSAKRIEPEGEGYLIREATVRNPRGKATGDEVIALRIVKRHKSGTIIDIWLEQSYANKKSNSSSSEMASNARQQPRTIRAGTVWEKSTKESRRETLKVMSKISRKEKLTEAELKSAAFH